LHSIQKRSWGTKNLKAKRKKGDPTRGEGRVEEANPRGRKF